MPDIIYYANAIQTKPFGKDVQEGIIEGLKLINAAKDHASENAITSGEAYDLIQALSDASEVKY